MIHFLRLRLSGFKSFVDPTEVAIEAGVTGVVGPNGCGKSNLVEALRWVMGETSAKQMRGAEMDDVIFGGTAQRPARNLAEVSLQLDNREHSAPALFNATDDIEVVRRIERGQGSLYKVNGREVRARDVHILFADAATGARSTAIVNQGRVGALINAKPADRRSLLEEAAGIGGLHSRRHEAETRLKAAEGNLERLQDVLTTLGGQMQALARQVRQATRYRNLSQQIRELEARLLSAQWAMAGAAVAAARASGAEVDRQVATLTGLSATAATRQAECAAVLPVLRQAEADSAAKLQRLVTAREALEAEEARLDEAKRDMELRLQQIASDLKQESARATDAADALARLEEERASLVSACADEETQQAAATATVEAISGQVARLDAELNRVLEEVAAADAERAAALRALAEAETRGQRLARRADEVAQQRERAAAEAVDQAELTSAEMDLEESLEHLEICRDQAEGAERRRNEAQAARERARDALQEVSARRAKLVAEADALNDLLGEAAGEGNRPVLDELTTLAGFETALGAALGDDLSAPVDAAEAPVTWTTLPPLEHPPALPGGVQPLSHFVTAPGALARRLGQVGLIDEAARGLELCRQLAPGQRLVSRDGDLWRWDGFVVRSGAPNSAAVRLRQKNRLRELAIQIEDADSGLEQAETSAAQAAAAVENETAAERRARDEVKRAETESARLRDSHAKLAQKAAAAQSRLAALSEQENAVLADLAEARGAEAAARQAVESFTGSSQARDQIAALRAEIAEQRTGLVEAQSLLDRLRREAGDRRRRLEAIGGEEASWTNRAAAAARRQQELAGRGEAARSELDRLAALPAEIGDRRAALIGEIAAAEDERRRAGAALADGEQGLAAADRALKEAEQALAAAREERVRREAATAAAEQAARTLAERIAERLDLTPDQLAAQTGEVDPSSIDGLSGRLERLVGEREAMGPVNLRAEAESEELGKQIAEMNAERDDLLAAIAKLRQAIVELNREGRERLLASFQTVDEHFRVLFVRLFGGGRAHLSLTESSDPLEAGLEIMASPPGKRLQVLSLLSGGEQALTALALLFAVFLTNPAPICVLDEVDAPLDDANVDRFCTLVAEIAQTSKTRFLIVTHHRMTMARVDRLFGVTMSERGVSTLVSVDLQTAEALTEAV